MPEDVLVHGWFDPADDINAVIARLKSSLQNLREKYPNYGTLFLESREIPDENWAESWKANYRPLRAGKHLVIKPTWETFDPLPGDKIIELDPGMA